MKKSGDKIGAFTITQTVHHEGGTDYYLAVREGMGGFTQHVLLQHLPKSLNIKVDQRLANARTAGLLSHTNIVQVLDVKGIEDGWYIAMEYVDGPSLKELIQRCSDRRQLIPISQALYITLEILSALHYSHTRGIKRGNHRQNLVITHNDLRPENILIDMQGGVKIWGFSKDHPPKTRTAYHPAEPTLDIRSDIYSAAALLSFMLTGKHPHQWSKPIPQDAETAQSYSLITPEIMRNKRPSIDSGLIAIITQALSYHPSARFQSAAAMKEALQKHIDPSFLLTSSIALSALLTDLFAPITTNDDAPTMVSKTQPISDILSRPFTVYNDNEPSTIAQFVIKEGGAQPGKTQPKKVSALHNTSQPRPSIAPNSLPQPQIFEETPVEKTISTHLYARRIIIGILWVSSVLVAFLIGSKLRPKILAVETQPQLYIVLDNETKLEYNGEKITSGQAVTVSTETEIVLEYEKENIKDFITIPPLSHNEIRYIDLRTLPPQQ